LLQKIFYKKPKYSLNLNIEKKKLLIKRKNTGFILPVNGKVLNKQQLFFPSSALTKSFFTMLYKAQHGFRHGYYASLRPEGIGLRFIRYHNAPNLLGVTVGHAHSILVKIPNSVKFRCLKYRLFLYSKSFSRMIKTALRIRSCRVPDAYKSKGLKFSTEPLKLKPGKIKQR
jgi:large subunit ribosomal protein L6